MYTLQCLEEQIISVQCTRALH